ncbi:hypothetical protein [Bartonella sp. AC67GZZY]
MHTLPVPNVATAPLEFESIRKKHALVFTLCFKDTTPAYDGKANDPH